MFYTKDDIALAIIVQGKKMQITPRGIVIGIATALVESELTFYANSNYPASLDKRFKYDAVGSNGTSVNYDQQQNFPEWGSLEERMDLYAPARMFNEHMLALEADNGDPIDYNDPQNTPGQIAQWVQRSAYPDRYDKRIGDAQAIYDRLSGGAVLIPKFFDETNLISSWRNWDDQNSQARRFFVLHTSEGASDGPGLIAFMRGAEVSYHYVVDDQGHAWDLVDTDDDSWSVLDANDYTVNLVFAGSFSRWTRMEWLQNMDGGIRIAAYLAVQDCRKYGIPIQLLVGNNYGRMRTEKGITDHNGITVGLGIGTHTDVGKNFPWDVFWQYVTKFMTETSDEGDEDLTPEQWSFIQALGEKVDRIEFELTNKWDSRSPYADPVTGKSVDTLAGYTLFTDAYANAADVEAQAKAGDQDSIEKVARTAAGAGIFGDAAWAVERATRVLNSLPPTTVLEETKP